MKKTSAFILSLFLCAKLFSAYPDKVLQVYSKIKRQGIEKVIEKYPKSNKKYLNKILNSVNKHCFDPALCLSVIAIESAFNPYALSTNKDMGLMQISSKVHKDVSFDIDKNIKQGSSILNSNIKEFLKVQDFDDAVVSSLTAYNQGITKKLKSVKKEVAKTNNFENVFCEKTVFCEVNNREWSEKLF